jgi:hypothetical protein
MENRRILGKSWENIGGKFEEYLVEIRRILGGSWKNSGGRSWWNIGQKLG